MLSRLVLILAALALTEAAGAQIYQCVQDGARVFSDRPCGDDARPFESDAAVSYIPPDETLPALAESARRFIAERRERLSRANERPAAVPPAPGVAVRTGYLSPWLHPRGHERRPHGPHPSGMPPEPARYSPLNGPILGTRGREPYRVRLANPDGRSGLR